MGVIRLPQRKALASGNSISDILLIACFSALIFQFSFTFFSTPTSGDIEEERRLEGLVDAPPSPPARHRGLAVDDERENQMLGSPKHNGRLRVLWGIVTADVSNDRIYRRRHRLLFELWNDERVCSLDDFESRSIERRYQCELIYTFVVGANPDATPQLVDDSRPILAKGRIQTSTGSDLNSPDVTRLNIRENMNEGKSQTWMYYGGKIAASYGLDYVAKCDADSLLHLHEFFRFAYKNLPPTPYNTGIYAGALRDKAYWPKHEDKDRAKFESYFGNNYDGVHLYVAGQMYIVSMDLAQFIGEEAKRRNCSYCEGHEDHDVTTIAFHSPNPVKIVAVGRSHRFWEHPVKGENRWKRMLAREKARMAGKPFEGKVFSKNSTLADVLGTATTSTS